VGRSARSSLLVPLAISALFHLSMVTVFSISVWFKIEPVNYFSFHIVDHAPSTPAQRREAGERLNLPPLDDALALPSDEPADRPLLSATGNQLQSLTVSGPDFIPAALPRIQLPKLGLAQLGDLRIQDEKLTVDPRNMALESQPPLDSWARFGEGLGRLRNAMSRLPFFSRTQAAPPGRSQAVEMPLEGVAAHIEWLSEPKDRKLLFTAPIQGLLHFDTAGLREPLVLGFKVNADGTVAEVLAPVEDETGLITGISQAVGQYRSEPAENAELHEQHGTLTVAAVASAVP